MNPVEQVAKATYEQRMRNMFPGFDDRLAIHPRLGLGSVLTYEELPETEKEKERAIAKAAIAIIAPRVVDNMMRTYDVRRRV